MILRILKKILKMQQHKEQTKKVRQFTKINIQKYGWIKIQYYKLL